MGPASLLCRVRSMQLSCKASGQMSACSSLGSQRRHICISRLCWTWRSEEPRAGRDDGAALRDEQAVLPAADRQEDGEHPGRERKVRHSSCHRCSSRMRSLCLTTIPRQRRTTTKASQLQMFNTMLNQGPIMGCRTAIASQMLVSSGSCARTERLSRRCHGCELSAERL